MCGRFLLVDDPRRASPLPVAWEALPAFRPRYNIAPGSPVTVLSYGRNERLVAVTMRWGLVPSWSSGPDTRVGMINARAETLGRKPAFRDAFRRRRAVIPASGYYEWQAGDKGAKQPYLIAPRGGGLLYFAALWERWRKPDGELLLSTTIVTTAAIDSVRRVHARMPVILTAEESLCWLAADVSPGDLERLMTIGASQALETRPVHPRVGNPRVDGPECIEIQ